MSEKTVKISERNKELIDDIAGQMKTSRKEVVDMIFTWFFSFDAEEALEVVDEADILDEDEEEEE